MVNLQLQLHNGDVVVPSTHDVSGMRSPQTLQVCHRHLVALVDAALTWVTTHVAVHEVIFALAINTFRRRDDIGPLRIPIEFRAGFGSSSQPR